MIDRYTRPEMGHIFSLENKYAIWQEIEVLACEAQAELGKIGISKDEAQWIRDHANFEKANIISPPASIRNEPPRSTVPPEIVTFPLHSIINVAPFSMITPSSIHTSPPDSNVRVPDFKTTSPSVRFVSTALPMWTLFTCKYWEERSVSFCRYSVAMYGMALCL